MWTLILKIDMAISNWKCPCLSNCWRFMYLRGSCLTCIDICKEQWRPKIQVFPIQSTPDNSKLKGPAFNFKLLRVLNYQAWRWKKFIKLDVEKNSNYWALQIGESQYLKKHWKRTLDAVSHLCNAGSIPSRGEIFFRFSRAFWNFLWFPSNSLTF